MKSYIKLFSYPSEMIIGLVYRFVFGQNKFFISLLLLFGLINAMAQRTTDPAYEKMLNKLLSHKANEISVKDASVRTDVVFIDVREKEEYEVSHVQNAIWAGYNDFNIERISGVDLKQQIIIYCSVGYRSEKICLKLARLGYDKTYNLFGGIFEWVNQGLPVYHEQGVTTKVHAYSEEWGKWLTKGEKVFSD